MGVRVRCIAQPYRLDRHQQVVTDAPQTLLALLLSPLTSHLLRTSLFSQVLLAAGSCAVNARSADRYADSTPLHLAIKHGHAPLLAPLLAARADLEMATRNGDRNGATPLVLAASAEPEALDTVLALLAAGAQVDGLGPGETTGCTALCAAAGARKTHHEATARALLAAGAAPGGRGSGFAPIEYAWHSVRFIVPRTPVCACT